MGHAAQGEVDTAAVVDFAHPHGDRIAHVHHVFHLFHPGFRELGDVDHALLARQDLNEGTDRDDAGDGTAEHLSLADAAGKAFNDALGLLGGGAIVAGDRDDAAIFDVDLGVGALRDALDRAAAGADHGADQLRINAEAEQARGVGRHGVAGLVDRLEHLLEDMQPGGAGLLDGFGNRFDVEARDLHVHLQGGDALLGAGHLEVHIAEEILDALNVGKDAHLVALLDQAHRRAAHRSLEGHTGIHQGQGAAAHRTHRGGAVGAEALRHHAQHVGEGLLVGQHGHNRPLSQGAVANFAAAGGAHRLGFAGGVGGEVVVVEVVLLGGRVEVVHFLGVARGAEGGAGEHLGEAALEQR